MSKKFNYLYTILQYYHQEFLNFLYGNKKKVSNKMDKSWVGLKIKNSVIPKGWSKEGAFSFLQKEYNGKIMKSYRD